MIKTAKGDYNAILLDVDNGPQALTLKDNDWLYSLQGLKTAFAALQSKGVLAIWSSGPEPAFAQRLRKAGFDVDEVRVRARRGRKRWRTSFSMDCHANVMACNYIARATLH